MVRRVGSVVAGDGDDVAVVACLWIGWSGVLVVVMF